jgi:hypothetical protein
MPMRHAERAGDSDRTARPDVTTSTPAAQEAAGSSPERGYSQPQTPR